MIYSYLFEAKSIQNYLFRTGKLKDVIAASERLDSLIDDNENSLLYKVLTAGKISSDLIEQKKEAEPTSVDVHFIRCKGGAFYCYSDGSNNNIPEALKLLRSSWTLTVQQLFPGLEFTDALTSAEDLKESIKQGHIQMAADRNTPVIKFPLATAITQRYPKTGQVAVQVSEAAKKESKGEDVLDVDTKFHREVYENIKEEGSAALQNKFTPDKELLNEEIHYPINLEEDFNYSAKKEKKKKNKEAIRDMALIHIDGNGLGVLLRALQDALKGESDEAYCKAFRGFSSSLAKATQYAAQQATLWLYEQGRYQLEKSDITYIPMRPLVLGGDDVTLLCRADLALEYSKIFCNEFRKSSEIELNEIHEKYDLVTEIKDDKSNETKTIKIKNHLTASGGILYHKASHPFTHSHHLVEALCDKAKKLTKSIEETPASLAFYRLSNTALDDINALFKQSQEFTVQDNVQVDLALNAYLVDKCEDNPRTFENLTKCITLANKNNAAVAINKWRQMATHLSMGDKTEADRVYQRALDLASANGKTNLEEQQQALANITKQEKLNNWCWPVKTDNGANEKLQTIISDMLIIDHFTCTEPTTQEQS